MSAFKSRATPLVAIIISSAAFGFILACATLQSNNNASASAHSVTESTAAAPVSEPRTVTAPQAPPRSSPVKAIGSRDVYYPGTEDLGPNEMRIVACGTGMPNARPKQAAACWLVELGNGDKFIFDIGSGSSERISAMKIPYD